MDISALVVGALSGAVVSWGVTKARIFRSSQDAQRISSMLAEDVKQLLRNSRADRLSVKELHRLIDEEAAGFTPPPLPYEACPKCGSKNISERAVVDYSNDEQCFNVECKECGWVEWTQ